MARRSRTRTRLIRGIQTHPGRRRCLKEGYSAKLLMLVAANAIIAQRVAQCGDRVLLSPQSGEAADAVEIRVP